MSNMVRLGAVYLVIITAIFLVSCTKSPPELFEDARQQELRGDIVGATLTLMSALQLDPNNGVMRFMLGRLYNAQFEPTKAEGELKKARKAGVLEGGRLAVELGRALRYQGKFSEVLKLAVPDNSFEKDQLAQVFALRGRAQNALALSEDAYESLAQATKLDANDSDVLLLRAVLDADKSDFDGALSIINKALERNPRHFESRQVTKSGRLFASKLMTGSTLDDSSSSVRYDAPGRVETPPTSMRSAPSSSI